MKLEKLTINIHSVKNHPVKILLEFSPPSEEGEFFAAHTEVIARSAATKQSHCLLSFLND